MPAAVRELAPETLELARASVQTAPGLLLHTSFPGRGKGEHFQEPARTEGVRGGSHSLIWKC